MQLVAAIRQFNKVLAHAWAMQRGGEVDESLRLALRQSRVLLDVIEAALSGEGSHFDNGESRLLIARMRQNLDEIEASLRSTLH